MKKVDKINMGLSKKSLYLMFISLLVSIIVLGYQVYQDKEQSEYTNFIDTLKYYDSLREERVENWNKVKEVVTSNPKTAWEIPDKQDSLTYLKIRADQDEPLYTIEHGILEREIKSLNLLNELCRMAKSNKKIDVLLKLVYSSEISYYQNRLQDLLYLYEKEKQYRRFSKPKYEIITTFKISDVFDEEK